MFYKNNLLSYLPVLLLATCYLLFLNPNFTFFSFSFSSSFNFKALFCYLLVNNRFQSFFLSLIIKIYNTKSGDLAGTGPSGSGPQGTEAAGTPGSHNAFQEEKKSEEIKQLKRKRWINLETGKQYKHDTFKKQ